MRIRNLESLSDLVREAALEFGAARALQTAASADAGLSYAQLLEYAERGASHLHRLNIARGDRVLLAVSPRPEWAAAFFAILRAGLVVVPVPVNTPPRSAAAIARSAGIRAVIFCESSKELARATDGSTRIPIDEFVTEPAQRADPVATKREDLALLAFTSGSTRQPQAVELTHHNLLSNLDAVLQVRCVGPGDALLSMLPPAHLFELTGGLLGPLACGARIVYAQSPLPNRLVEALAQHDITHALCVPALVELLYEEVVAQLIDAGLLDTKRRGQTPAVTAEVLQSELDDAELERLRAGVRSRIGLAFRTLIVGGAAADPTMAAIVRTFGIRMEVGYGLTEASPIVSIGFAKDCPLGSVGRPLPGVEVRIGRDDEILVRGESVMRGYLGDEAATAQALEDGWLHTGDRGRLDHRGFLFVTGRIKEAMVTPAGETIFPEEVEPYYSDPLFDELCVTGLPGKNGNDLPTLFLVPSSTDLEDQTIEERFASLRASAPPRCRVERWIRLARPLPRTATGKIRRRFLARESTGQG